MSVMAHSFVCEAIDHLSAALYCHSFGPVGFVHFHFEHSLQFTRLHANTQRDGCMQRSPCTGGTDVKLTRRLACTDPSILKQRVGTNSQTKFAQTTKYLLYYRPSSFGQRPNPTVLFPCADFLLLIFDSHEKADAHRGQTRTLSIAFAALHLQ